MHSCRAMRRCSSIFGKRPPPWRSPSGMARLSGDCHSFRPWLPPGWTRLAFTILWRVAWNYCGFLHASRGFPWTKAHFMSEAIERYWMRRAEGGKPKNPFPYDARDLESFVCRTCRDFTAVNGVRAVSFLESAWHFSDYLLACGLAKPRGGRSPRAKSSSWRRT